MLCSIEFKLDREIDHHSKVPFEIGVIPLQSFLYFYFFLSVYNLANNDNKGRCTYGLLKKNTVLIDILDNSKGTV